MNEDDENATKSFSERSIRVIASRLGIDNLSSPVCRHISKEAVYKTNELIHTAKKIMYRNKRPTLTTDDIQKAISLLGDVQVYGHDNVEPSNFTYDPNKSVYREHDCDVNLVILALDGKTTRNQFIEPIIQGKWILPDDPASQNDKCDPYYEELAKIVLGGNTLHVQVALNDLRTNSKISSIAPLFLNFIASTLPNVREVALIENLLDAVYALALNQYVDPNPYHAVNRVFEAVLNVAIGTYGPQDRPDWSIRTKAGLLLEKLLSVWAIGLKQLADTASTLCSCLKEGYPVQSHYGAILALTTLVPSLPAEEHQMYWQVIEEYFARLDYQSDLSGMDENVKHLMVAVLVAWRNESKVDQLLYAIFGDSVVPFRMPRCASRTTMSTTCRSSSSPALVSRGRLRLKLQSCSPDRPQWYVQRSLKHCRPSHTRSAVGDISLTL